MINARFVPLKHYTVSGSSLLCLVFSTFTNCSEHAQLDMRPHQHKCAKYKNGLWLIK